MGHTSYRNGSTLPLFSGKTEYKSDIVLGDRYIDKQTGFEGVATSTSFFQHACERIVLETFDTERVIECVFDAPRLTHVETQKVATSTKTGGPRDIAGQRGSNAR
jgi:hypothetical protein